MNTISQRPLHSRQYLGEYLVQHGFICRSQLDLALKEQAGLPVRYRLGDILVLRGWISREVLEAYMEKVVAPKRKRQQQGGLLSPAASMMLSFSSFQFF